MKIVRVRAALASIVIAGFTIALWPQAASHTQATYDAAARSAEHKFAHIEQNGKLAHPDPTPTVLTEREVNAWFSSGQADLPKGVHRLQLQADPGIIHGTADVDFDQVTGGRYSANPLASLFRGVHQVAADAHALGANGTGQVHIDSVSLDGIAVPRIALEYFVDHYIHPKYPDLGIDSIFKLPNRIDHAEVGSHQVTIVQR
jgi:hypothetical protein